MRDPLRQRFRKTRTGVSVGGKKCFCYPELKPTCTKLEGNIIDRNAMGPGWPAIKRLVWIMLKTNEKRKT